MNIDKIDNRVIDRIIANKDSYSKGELFDMFWDMEEGDARTYAENRWFALRSVRQNHITRKVKRFWTTISAAVRERANEISVDPSYPKVYRVWNPNLKPSNTLCYLKAGSRDEALQLANILMPRIDEGDRYVDLVQIAQADSVQMIADMRNAQAISLIRDEHTRRSNDMQQYLNTTQAHLDMLQGRMDAFNILVGGISMMGKYDDEQPEEPNENKEVQP